MDVRFGLSKGISWIKWRLKTVLHGMFEPRRGRSRKLPNKKCHSSVFLSHIIVKPSQEVIRWKGHEASIRRHKISTKFYIL